MPDDAVWNFGNGDRTTKMGVWFSRLRLMSLTLFMHGTTLNVLLLTSLLLNLLQILYDKEKKVLRRWNYV